MSGPFGGDIATSGGGGGGATGATGASGATTFAQLGQVITTGSQATVTFSSIPGTYSNLLVVMWGRDTAAGSSAVNVFQKINNDGTAANYSSSNFLEGSGGSASSSTTAASTNGQAIANLPGTSGNANAIGGGNIFIPAYASTAFRKLWFTNSFASYGAGPTLDQINRAGVWFSTAAITRLDYTAGATAFVDGSIFTLYGLV